MEAACLRVRRPYGCLPTHAGSPEGERMELFDRKVVGEAGGYIATTIYSLCLGSFCNEMACVMEALSKQWAYSTWRGVSSLPKFLPKFLLKSPLESLLESLLEFPLESPLESPLEFPFESPLEFPLESPLESLLESPLKSLLESQLQSLLKFPL
ncbi:hypothetical protein NQZ68_007174 [Dissostichus eleginoides]|nr:hypothetical protein NQZ68_007174 [Dissostichus eleginoides]